MSTEGIDFILQLPFTVNFGKGLISETNKEIENQGDRESRRSRIKEIENQGDRESRRSRIRPMQRGWEEIYSTFWKARSRLEMSTPTDMSFLIRGVKAQRPIHSTTD